jgi:hypothetical protein
MFFLSVVVDVESGVLSLSPIFSFGWTGPVFAFLGAGLQPPVQRDCAFQSFTIFSYFV